jgi:hypothetical protein
MQEWEMTKHSGPLRPLRLPLTHRPVDPDEECLDKFGVRGKIDGGRGDELCGGCDERCQGV